jgi:hypothetical protein
VPTPTPFPSSPTPLPTDAPQSVAFQASRTPLPSVTPASQGSQPSGTPLPASPSAIATSTVAVGTAAAQPTSTSALLGMTPGAGTTALPTQPALVPGSSPPFDIDLPANWQYGFQSLPIRDRLVQASMNVAVYKGPIQGGTGTIIVLWGFPSLGPPPTPAGGQLPGTVVPGTLSPDMQQQMLWADGLRLLQGTVVDITCNVGNHSRGEFKIGGQPAYGEYFAAVQCQAEPDATGWFAGLNQYGGNFLFYVLIEPPQAYNNGRSEMQKILDTVVFRKPGETAVGPPPTNTSQPIPPTTTPALQ